jgi:hypothetical protein
MMFNLLMQIIPICIIRHMQELASCPLTPKPSDIGSLEGQYENF